MTVDSPVPSSEDVGSSKREEAARRFAALGLSPDAADALVTSVIKATAEQTLDVIMGSGPIPTSMTAAHADQLRYVCLHAGRMLSQREVEVLFRATPMAARSILTATQATYQTALRTQFSALMIGDATVTTIGNIEAGLRRHVQFTQELTFEFACAELVRVGKLGSVQRDFDNLTIEFDAALTAKVGGVELDLLAVLGIPMPTAKRSSQRERR